MKKINALPTISGAATRIPVAVTNFEDLKTSGVPFATYSVRKGDVIEFPDSWDDVQVFNQPVRANGTVNQALLVVLRNGNPDYLSIGSLRKQDVDRNYTSPFTEEMGKLNNDYDRINTLLGKKIKGVDSKTIKTQAFDRITGERLEGQTRDQVVPIIEYV